MGTIYIRHYAVFIGNKENNNSIDSRNIKHAYIMIHTILKIQYIFKIKISVKSAEANILKQHCSLTMFRAIKILLLCKIKEYSLILHLLTKLHF